MKKKTLTMTISRGLMEFVLDRLESIVGEGDNAGHVHFRKLTSLGLFKVCIVLCRSANGFKVDKYKFLCSWKESMVFIRKRDLQKVKIF